MGAAAATSEVLQALTELRDKDEDEYVREAAALALGKMGEAED
jgi:HEAT repeat protein